MSEYFIVLMCVGLPTILLSLHPQSNMRGRVTNALVSVAVAAVIFIAWDIWAYSRGHWGFNYDYIWDVNIAGLPIEELLFFVFIPYSTLYVWLVIRDFSSFDDLIQRIKNSSNA